MNTNASNKIATPVLLGTILSALLLALPEISSAAQSINSCADIRTSGNYKLVADLTGFPSGCISISASNVVLRLNGHTITGPGPNTSSFGILIAAQTNVSVKGPGVITNFGSGVRLDGTDSSEVTDVTATNNSHGFVVQRNFFTPDVDNLAEENLLTKNTATGNVMRGFALDGASHNSFLNNVASNNEEGFYVAAGTGNHFEGNTINGNTIYGLRVIASTEPSTAHTIENNNANGNGVIGIQLGGSSGNSVNNNTTLDNFVGISLQGSTSNNVNGNTALNSFIGISLQGSTGNNIDGNTALNNTTDLVDDSIACDNNIWTNNVFITANQACIQ